MIAVILGGAASAWIWVVRCKQLILDSGIRALAAMRWREFSRFVIEALQAQGFDANRIEPTSESGTHADLMLNRDGQTWLLSCKQGASYRINTTQVNELADAVRFNGAAGGILATLGRIEPDARKNHRGLELLDGATLWPLIDPLLPPSLHQDLVTKARASSIRMSVLAWLAALVLGPVLAIGLGLGKPSDGASAAPAIAQVEPAPTTAVPASEDAADAPASSTPTASAAGGTASSAPTSEQEQRVAVIRDVNALPGIERAVWSTRSTLMVYLADESGSKRVNEICRMLVRHDQLRLSRLQLQPPARSNSAVRFLQCSY
ncbi:restriction endonuclease [Montanilutibacter psychrotolerans]|uniref:restriction endonuclease n=1 Tax=Montanilutibacter psychrotolerans TaxID=1327343 RepID=UPI001680D513|nr:restriction endonuclease [Lysobacter psychrotolerans]